MSMEHNSSEGFVGSLPCAGNTLTLTFIPLVVLYVILIKWH